jgi:hypothetical protein
MSEKPISPLRQRMLRAAFQVVLKRRSDFLSMASTSVRVLRTLASALRSLNPVLLPR